MKNKLIRTIIGTALVTLPLAFAGCLDMKEPKREDYNFNRIKIDAWSEGRDLDKDEIVDAVYESNPGGILERPLFISERYKTDTGYKDRVKKGLTKIMSPEMEDALSRMLKASHDYDFAKDKMEYEEQQKRKQKEKILK